MGHWFPRQVAPPAAPAPFTPASPRIEFRKAIAEDRHRILAMDHDAFPADQLNWDEFQKAVLEYGWTLLVATKRMRGPAGMPKDEVVGYLLFQVEFMVGRRARAIIERMTVAHEHRFEGIGGALVFQAMVSLPEDRDAQAVAFVPEPPRADSAAMGAVLFFDRLGFVARGKWGRCSPVARSNRGIVEWRMAFGEEG